MKSRPINFQYIAVLSGVIFAVQLGGCSREASKPAKDIAFEAVPAGDIQSLENAIRRDKHVIKEDNELGESLLDSAIVWNQPKMVKILLAQGADARHRRTKDGYTPLHYAAASARIDMIMELLIAKADLEARMDGGMTPLMIAVYAHKEEAVKALLGHGANVNAVDETGRNSLWFAAKNNDPIAAKILLDAKIDINHRDVLGHSAIDEAKENNANDVLELLLSRMGKDQTF